jgi:hypothetical protein
VGLGVRSGSRGSCRARDWEAQGLCRVRGEAQHLRLVGSGLVSARDSCRARDWEALGSCRFGAHGVWGFGLVFGSGLEMGLGVRVGLGVRG